MKRSLGAGASVAIGLAAGAALLAAVTLFALEGGRVAVLETVSSTGETRRTHVWVAAENGDLWVEAATSERPFYLDLRSHPEVTVELRASGWDPSPTIVHGRAELVAEPGGHDRIRSLLRRDYGWADSWIALLTDTSGSRAVRIAPAERAAGSR